MSVNNIQIGGEHYRSPYQHWDFVETNGLGYLEGCATKYLARWREKGGVQDLEKAQHYVEKLYDLATQPKLARRPRGYAPPEDLARYCEANRLRPDEWMVTELLSQWLKPADLKRASQILRRMIRNERSRMAGSS